MTNKVTDSFLERCLAGDRALAGIVRDAKFPNAFDAFYRERLFPRPLFVGEQRVRRLGTDLQALIDLIVSLPQRLFDGDLGRYCAALDIDPARAAVLSESRERPVLYGRVDAYDDG
ncbi:hypothetical protein [Saccharothrix sp.]|uniref:hypothetical protein n=1 Tax=Saccharothrix sp. TaxID=1873460 RepID=UPI002811FE2A|nr:hypothetical protein [Saccharothrix sp.]